MHSSFGFAVVRQMKLAEVNYVSKLPQVSGGNRLGKFFDSADSFRRKFSSFCSAIMPQVVNFRNSKLEPVHKCWDTVLRYNSCSLNGFEKVRTKRSRFYYRMCQCGARSLSSISSNDITLNSYSPKGSRFPVFGMYSRARCKSIQERD